MPTTTAFLIHVNDVPEGVSSGTRNGARALFLSFQYRLTVTRNVAQVAGVGTIVRIIVLIDKRPNATALTDAELFESPGTPIESPYLLANNNRFNIMSDRLVNVSEFLPSKFLRSFSRMRLKTTWNAATGAITALTQGAIYFVLASDVGGLDVPSVNYISRLRWVG